MIPTPSPDRGWKRFLASLYLFATLALIWLAWRGWSFYATPLEQRPRHADWPLWHPGAPVGHSLGIVGTLFILLLLLYIPRKRRRGWQKLGSIKRWLDVHIWLGIFGPLLIILHSSLKFGGLVSFSFWSMVAVALSGVLGRYLYLQIPRDESGAELSAAEIQRQLDTLRSEAGLDAEAPPAGGPLEWLRQDLAWLFTRSRQKSRLAAQGVADPAELLRLRRRASLLRRRQAGLDLARRLLHHWHVFHRPFALIMIVFMLIHIVTVLLFGARWLHGGA